MKENEATRELPIKIALLDFIGKTIEAERKVTESEFRRCDAALEAHTRTEDMRHAAGDARIQKANEVLDYRLEEMNNFREQINLERADYLRREIYDRDHASLSERVKNLEIVGGEQTGKTTAYASVVGAVIIMAQIVLHFWK